MSRLAFERFALCHGTMGSIAPPKFVAAAAAAGFRQVSLRVAAPRAAATSPASASQFSMLANSAMRRETLTCLNDTGITLTEAEAILIRPKTRLEALEPTLEAAAYLGAAGVLCVFFDHDNEEHLAGQVSTLSVMMAPYRLQCLIEFLPSSAVRSLQAAQRILDKVTAKNTGIICDILHLARSGMNPDDFGAFDTRLIKSAQISDNMWDKQLSRAEMFEEAMTGRGFLGDGDFPLRDFVLRLPDHVPIGLEVLSGDNFARAQTPEQMAAFCATNVRQYFDIPLQ
jgi:sugar phosphate isomerase/epimerase